jgi:hypothetical protein
MDDGDLGENIGNETEAIDGPYGHQDMDSNDQVHLDPR